ncbi:MAG: 23S rRNA (guanosine(2251)-2'-O)-methyltransferase RlmB [Mycoplasmataceae bacterium]|nr:23S rRNA (guanosine(2251)-2'-O)-methyltransferase RlmB [Mycoplasmataceae bacterium]
MFIYGKNPVKDLFMKNTSLIKRIWIEKKRHQSFYNDLTNSNIKIYYFNEFKLKWGEFKGHENFQGIIAEIEEPKIYGLLELIRKNKDNNKTLFLILDQIEDPQNFGAILRNAAAFNVDGVIYPSRSAVGLNSTVMKTSSGNWMNVDLCETSSLNQVIDTLKKEGYWIISTTSDSTSSLDSIKELNQPKVIILGNEGKGVRKSLQNKSDFKISIEINKKVESLNVSSALAIILHYIK